MSNVPCPGVQCTSRGQQETAREKAGGLGHTSWRTCRLLSSHRRGGAIPETPGRRCVVKAWLVVTSLVWNISIAEGEAEGKAEVVSVQRIAAGGREAGFI